MALYRFEKQHWPALQMMLKDRGGREVGVNAPLPKSQPRTSRPLKNAGN